MEPCAPTWNIYEKLGVSSRTAAVTRAFPDRMAQDPPRAARPADQVTLLTPARSTGRCLELLVLGSA